MTFWGDSCVAVVTYWNKDANFDPSDDTTDKGRGQLQVQDKKDREKGGEVSYLKLVMDGEDSLKVTIVR